MEKASAGEEGAVLTSDSLLQGPQGQASVCYNMVAARGSRSNSSSSSSSSSISGNTSSSGSISESSSGSSSSEDTREYERHLVQAQRRDLSSIAATRALYIAGKDRRGRTCVVFSPDLVNHRSPPAPPPKNKSLKKRGNSQTTNHVRDLDPARQPQHVRRPSDTPSSGGNIADIEGGPSSVIDRKPSPRSQGAGKLDKGAVAASSHSSISGRGGASADSPRSRSAAVAVVGGQTAETPAAVGSLVALESSVGSAAMEELLLYFVRVMDTIADGEYVLLLCGSPSGAESGKTSGDASAILPGGERQGWLSWGRFSMLGQMHKLLPRRYKKNLAGLVVLQPTPVLHAFFDFANLFLSRKFYRKLEFCEDVEELSIRFPRRIIENLPEGVILTPVQGAASRQTTAVARAAIAAAPATATSRWHSSSAADEGQGSGNRGRSLASPRGSDVPPAEDDDRPSPLRVTRVVGAGMQNREQLQGDENWTPPPLPPPPLQSATSKPASPLLGGGSARAAAKDKGRFHRAMLEKRFSTSSATLTLTPKSTPSPGAFTSVTYASTPGTVMNSSASTTTSTANTKGSSGNSSSGNSKSGLCGNSVAFAEACTPTATVTTTPTRKHYASFGGGAYASVSAASSAATHGISPSSSAGGFSSMRSQQQQQQQQQSQQQTQQPQLRHLGSAPTLPSHRRGASTGGCWERGKGPHSFPGGGRTGGVSPTTPKGTGHNRRSAFANGGVAANTSLSPWSPPTPTAGNISGDRQGLRPSPSPSPRGRGVVTPRGTSAQRGSWGGSPCSVGSFRSSPTTPRHPGTPNQVSFASTSGLPARKGPRVAGSPPASGQRQPQQPQPQPQPQQQQQQQQQQQKQQQKQLHRLSSWPVIGGDVGGGSGWSSGGIAGGGNAGAASPRAVAMAAGTGWGGSGFHTVTGGIEVSQRPEARAGAPQKSKTSPRHLPQKSPRTRRPVDGGRISASGSSDRPENAGTTGASSGGPTKSKDARNRHSFTFANSSRGNARRSSSGQITTHQQQQQGTHPDSPLRPRPRSSSNILSPTEIAALEREVKCRSARVTSSAARSAGFIRYSVAARVSGSGGGSGSGSGFAVGDKAAPALSPSAASSRTAGDFGNGGDGNRAGDHGRGGAGSSGAAAGKARDRGERKTMTMATVTRTTGSVSSRNTRDTGGVAAARGGPGTESIGYCPAPADHPPPLRRASEGAQVMKSAAAASRSSRGRGGRTGVTGRTSVSGCGGGSTVKQLSTSARISPGIQALMANYGAATRASAGPASASPSPFSKAATTAAGSGGGGGLREASTTASTPRAALPSPSPSPPAAAASLPSRTRALSPPASGGGVFASVPGGGGDNPTSDAAAPTATRTAAPSPTSTLDVEEAGVGSARGSSAVGASANNTSSRSQQQQRRSQHRCDAGGMRRALRKHRESLQSALKAEGAAAAVAAAVAEAKAAEEEAADNGGVVAAGNVGRSSEALQRRRKPPDASNKVFGVPLVDILRRTPGEEIPWVLKRFVSFLSKFGLESVGLFRLAGDGMDRAVLRDALDHGKPVCWDPAEERQGGQSAGVRLTDVNMVAQLLKAFVRELPEPLIPFSVYAKVVAIAKATGVADARWVQAMKSILWAIPNANYNCLRFLFEFLREVASHSSTNRMTSENLAIVWAPNLLRPQDDDPFAILRDLRFQIETVRWMVDCCDQLFDD